MVPDRRSGGTPCSSPATMKLASTGSTAPFMVMETLMRSSGMPSNRIFMSSTESIATPCLADIAHHAGMVAVVAAMGGKIEGHRQAHLPRLQILAVKQVGFLGGREAGILPDGPGPAGIHAGARPAGERRLTRPGAGLNSLQIGFGIERLDRDAFGAPPAQVRGLAGLEFPRHGLFPLLATIGHGAMFPKRRRSANPHGFSPPTEDRVPRTSPDSTTGLTNKMWWLTLLDKQLNV